MHDKSKLVIIGDGFAAAVTAIHLLRKGIAADSFTIIGPGPLGKGHAYGCESPSFRLNVREDLPIVFSDDPLHFARWAKTNIDDSEAKTSAGNFYRRADFGRYVSELVAAEVGFDQIQRIPSKVSRLNQVHDGLWRLDTTDGHCIHSERVIIATGNSPPTWPCAIKAGPGEHAASRLIENPWTGQYLAAIGAEEHVVLLGGGLTALDAIYALATQGHRGPITIVGPRSVFPPTQAQWTRQKQPNWPEKLSPAKLLRFMRQYLPSAPTTSSEWQCAWEELRPNLNTIWQQLTPHQRQILFKRLGWAWSLYRFRASPQTIKAYEQLRANHQVQFAVGRAKQVECSEGAIMVQLNNGQGIQADRIVNCTGVGRDVFLDRLVADSIALPDPLGHAVGVNTKLNVIKPNLQAWNNLWMLGPATMGSLGDVIAASAISKQAEELALQIASLD
ncbi:FAD/NAD(P)-binding protein [Polynucleobacter sp.]|uniref:FAD/NAD(P)-binding protein n=1 Tax=Polynucleobacter sp. TaxID=2029855 RepID=UPI002732FD89|nr:FAD/NAD(P)-binding protein [Polynucleobacter sp.]MDP3121562.1 FAD/NAD(P)-binding protein [Polynucleobacter sp.]